MVTVGTASAPRVLVYRGPAGDGADMETKHVAQNWIPASWRQDDFTAKHLPDYEDAAALADATQTLGGYPPLVFAGEARELKAELGKVAKAARSCCRAAIAPKASPNSARTISAIPSA